jgi:hypothetical protein
MSRQSIRALQVALTVGLIASAVATALFLVAFFAPGALVAAGAAAAFWIALLVVAHRRRTGARHRRGLARTPAASQGTLIDLEAEPAAVPEPWLRRPGLIVMVSLVALAVLLAGILAGWRFLGVAGLLFFIMMLAYGAPVWIAAAEDSEEGRERRAGTEP